jgi:hypothetical protein
VINNWQVPRNKRKLYPVVDILSLFNLQTIGDNWSGNIHRQLDFETESERFGLKRPGVCIMFLNVCNGKIHFHQSIL